MPNDSLPLLGIPRERASAAPETQAWLTFRLGTEEYGVEAGMVRGVSMPADLPLCRDGGPGSIVGVTFLQGAVVPVVDPGLQRASAREHPMSMVLLDISTARVGVLVETVGDLVRLKPEDVLPPPRFPRGGDTAYVVGIGTPPSPRRGRTIVLIDLRKWWSDRCASAG